MGCASEVQELRDSEMALREPPRAVAKPTSGHERRI